MPQSLPTIFKLPLSCFNIRFVAANFCFPEFFFCLFFFVCLFSRVLTKWILRVLSDGPAGEGEV